MSTSGLERLVRALSRRDAGIDDWSARASATRVGWRRRDVDGERGGAADLRRYRAAVHLDVPAGRGSAALDVDGEAAVVAQVDDAIARARATIGPAWSSPPPSAPARVELADPRVTDPDAIAGELTARLTAAARAAGATVRELEVEVVRRTVSMATRGGLDASWDETELALSVELTRGDRRASVQRRARRLDELAIDDALARALADADRRARAEPIAAGAIDVVLDAPALLHGGDGLLAALAGPADAALDRRGLLAARVGQPLVDGGAAAAEPLTVLSDGTLPFGLRSAPVADDGAPVRRFPLVERGLVRGLALDAREAALRGAQPNGGVRGLVVPPGGQEAAALVDGPGPRLVVEALHWLELDAVTGRFRARIALARRVDGGGARDVRDGLVRGDARAALALARRSRERVETPLYRGPRWWAVGPLTVEPF